MQFLSAQVAGTPVPFKSGGFATWATDLQLSAVRGLTVTETEAPAFRSNKTATAEQNIQQFRRRLEYGAKEVTRSVLLKLLLADEKMLGLTDQQLQRTDRHIAKLRQLISQQTTRIERLASFGIGTEGNRLVLTTLNDLMATYQIHRQRITATLVGEAEQ